MSPGPTTIAVHLVDLDAPEFGEGEAERWLSPGEAARAKGARDRGERRRFVNGRAALRASLGPAGVGTEFTVGANGKPSLVGAAEFSFADSGRYALVAIAPRPVGIDIELVRDVDVARDWPDRYPALAVMRRGDERADDSAAVRFLRAWTRLEALVKRDGGRLGRALDGMSTVEVTPSPLANVIDIEIAEGIIAACATHGAAQVAFSHFDPSHVARAPNP